MATTLRGRDSECVCVCVNEREGERGRERKETEREGEVGDELRRHGTVERRSAHGTQLAAGGELQRGETTEQRGMRLMHRFLKKLVDHSWMHEVQMQFEPVD